jgi:hypothetical protein
VTAAAAMAYSASVAHYLVESSDFSVDHDGRTSQGVIGEHKGKEKIYLHVLQVADSGLLRLAPRVDEQGNRQHDRLALPTIEEWWFAVEGEAAWPGIYRPRFTSRCTDVATKPRPVALSAEDLERLRTAGWKGT